ncbi:potassium channel family protein [Flammeovirga sp. SubArs3]|uniref:potassium channel family protein n=1 Tax=Flammeovirga sp. SubArs3 TaxID=2995316 RepID=UPI00248B09F9|nr:potassium channel family protein [Flammeovirga sp. SubArs3]
MKRLTTVLTIISLISIVVETYISSPILDYLEWICVFIFSIEIIIDARNKKFSWINIISVAPFLFGLGDFRFVRILRVSKLFRVLKLERVSKSFQLIGRVFNAKKDELIATGILGVILVYICSVLMYHIEPETFGTMGDAFYYSCMTLSTIGYGDISPVTEAGKIFACIQSILGLGMFGLPAGLLGSGFMDELEKK